MSNIKMSNIKMSNNICLDLNNLVKITDINSLVISGGGMKGYLMLGTIKLLSEYDIIKKIKYFYGTSFGGLIVTCLNLGWDIDSSLKFTVNFPLECIIDFDIDSLILNYGLVPKINYETIFKKIIKFKNYDENITFKQLFNSTSKELNLITYSIKENKSVVLNHINTPDLMIWEGLYMTSALPILIPPYEYKNNIYIDGGMSENFAINRIKSFNRSKTIGIYTNSYNTDIDKLKNNIANKNILNYIEYTFELIKILFCHTKKYSNKNFFNLNYEQLFSNSTTINFTMDNNSKLKLIDSGYKQSTIQLSNIINHLFKMQINDYQNKSIKFKHFSKYNEI
jgi:predicted acylesterase/phospholipase RssA